MKSSSRFQGTLRLHIQSLPVKIFLTVFILHILVQVILNLVLPFAAYSQSHDGSLYYNMSLDPLPEEPVYTSKRYQRPLLALLTWVLVPWNRHIGFIIVNTMAVSMATLYFYRIIAAKEYEYAIVLRLVILFVVIPYLFAGVHIGLTGPLMMAGLLGGYYYAQKDKLWKASIGYAVAILAKEIAILPVLAELVLQWRKRGIRSLGPLAFSFVPVGIWYLLVAFRWHDLFWMLKGPVEEIGFGPAAIGAILRNPPVAEGSPPLFFTLNQIANSVMLVLVFAGLYVFCSNKRMIFWVGFSVFPLLFLGQAVYKHNFDIGRQALPALLLLTELGQFRLFSKKLFYWPVVVVLLNLSLFWILYHAKYFVLYKFV